MLCQNETKPLITILLEEIDENDLNKKAQDLVGYFDLLTRVKI